MNQFKKNILKQVPIYLLMAFCSVAYGQNKLTNEMITKINATDKQDIFSVAETVKFSGQILRANEIVFGPDCVLELTNLDHEWIVIIADKIKFTAPLKKATIKRGFEVVAAKGKNAEGKGSDGAYGDRGSGRSGKTGGAGGDGQKGGKGETKQLPKIYIVTNQVTSQESQQAPDFINLKLIFPGIDGENGGNGGIGGNGGNGGNGLKSASGVIDCKRGAGNGGNGGVAGKGGQGGDAGDGGNGADITFIGSETALEVLSYSVVVNTGGDSGIPGQPGSVGTPGSGGSGGSGSTHCSGGDRGSNGGNPNPLNGGVGSIGREGAKGKVEKHKITEFTTLAFN